jgi:hypothetical protein
LPAFLSFLLFFFFLSLDTGFPFFGRGMSRQYHFSSHLCNRPLFQIGDMPWTRKRVSIPVAKS